MAVRHPQKALTGIRPHWHPNLVLPACRTVRNRFLWFRNHTFCDTLVQQPKPTPLDSFSLVGALSYSLRSNLEFSVFDCLISHSSQLHVICVIHKLVSYSLLSPKSVTTALSGTQFGPSPSSSHWPINS